MRANVIDMQRKVRCNNASGLSLAGEYAVLDFGVSFAEARTSIPMPVGPEAPVTQTTLPFRLKRSLRESALGISIGMMGGGRRYDVFE